MEYPYGQDSTVNRSQCTHLKGNGYKTQELLGKKLSQIYQPETELEGPKLRSRAARGRKEAENRSRIASRASEASVVSRALPQFEHAGLEDNKLPFLLPPSSVTFSLSIPLLPN